MKVSLRRLPVLVALLFMLAGCQPPRYTIQLQCSDGVQFRIEDRGSELIEEFEKKCGETLAGLQAQLEPVLQRWREIRRTKGVSSEFRIEPRTAAREQALAAEAVNYKSCYYAEAHHAEEWIFSWRQTRSYCMQLIGTLRPAPRLYHGRFALYLLTHPGPTTLPYLWPYLGVLAALLLPFGAIAWKRELSLALKPGGWHVGVILVSLCVLLQVGINDPPLIVLCYLLASLPQWYVRRRAQAQQDMGKQQERAEDDPADREAFRQKGKILTLGIVTAIMLLLGTFLILYQAHFDLGKILRIGINFTLIGLACYFLYRGAHWARWLFIAMFGLTGMLVLRVLSDFSIQHTFPVAALAKAIACVTIAALLIWSKSVNSFLEYQRKGKK